MKSKWITEKIKYDGTQLKSLFAYLEHGVLGDSIVSWVGPCQVSFDHMVDGEDLRERAAIRGGQMLHFVIEIFHQNLFSGVLLQRLFTSIVADEIFTATKGQVQMKRTGDDLYFKKKKLSISIAAVTVQSVMIHFAVNVVNEGTPVPTCALKDFGINPKSFSEAVMKKLVAEIVSIKEATVKVRPLGSY